jgi:hypothetical protein
MSNKLNHESKKHIPLPFSADRAGIHTAIIEIDFQITQRNERQGYSLLIDYTINDHITIAETQCQVNAFAIY